MGSIGNFAPMGISFGALGAPSVAAHMDKSIAMDGERSNVFLAIAQTQREDMERRKH